MPSACRPYTEFNAIREARGAHANAVTPAAATDGAQEAKKEGNDVGLSEEDVEDVETICDLLETGERAVIEASLGALHAAHKGSSVELLRRHVRVLSTAHARYVVVVVFFPLYITLSLSHALSLSLSLSLSLPPPSPPPPSPSHTHKRARAHTHARPNSTFVSRPSGNSDFEADIASMAKFVVEEDGDSDVASGASAGSEREDKGAASGKDEEASEAKLAHAGLRLVSLGFLLRVAAHFAAEEVKELTRMGAHNLAVVFAPNLLREGAVYEKPSNDDAPGQPGVVNIFNPLQALEDSKREVAVMQLFINLAIAIADKLGSPKLRVDGGIAVDLQAKGDEAAAAEEGGGRKEEEGAAMGLGGQDNGEVGTAQTEAETDATGACVEEDQGVGLAASIARAESK